MVEQYCTGYSKDESGYSKDEWRQLMAIDWGAELGGNSPQGSAVSAVRNNPEVAVQSDPVKMLQYAKDAGTRNVESMGQIGASWFDGIPQVYDDDQIAAAKSAISRAQTPEEVTQIIQGLAGQNHGGNVGPINNALGQMGVGYSSDAGLSDIGRGVRSMTGTLDRVDVPAEDDYERALQWLGNAIPNVAAIGDFAIPLPSGAASTVHLYKGAKALPGKVVSGVKAAPGKAADWYKGRYNAYSDRLAGKKPAAPAGETAQTGGRAAETAETAAPAAERTAASETAAPATERTAASETAAPAPRQESAPAPEPAPAPRQGPAPADGSPELRSNADGTPDLAGTINSEGRAGEAAGGAPKTGAGEAAGSAPATGNVPKRGEAFGDVTWSEDIAARDQAADFVTSGKYGVDQVADWYRDRLISNASLDNAAIDREIARFIQQFAGGAK